jgi:hypothetical protein
MSDDYTAILLEDMNHKFDVILEGQANQATSIQLQAVDERLTRVENEMIIMRKVLTEHSQELQYHGGRLNDHDKRITRLEHLA